MKRRGQVAFGNFEVGELQVASSMAFPATASQLPESDAAHGDRQMIGCHDCRVVHMTNRHEREWLISNTAGPRCTSAARFGTVQHLVCQLGLGVARFKVVLQSSGAQGAAR